MFGRMNFLAPGGYGGDPRLDQMRRNYLVPTVGPYGPPRMQRAPAMMGGQISPEELEMLMAQQPIGRASVGGPPMPMQYQGAHMTQAQGDYQPVMARGPVAGDPGVERFTPRRRTGVAGGGGQASGRMAGPSRRGPMRQPRNALAGGWSYQ